MGMNFADAEREIAELMAEVGRNMRRITSLQEAIIEELQARVSQPAHEPGRVDERADIEATGDADHGISSERSDDPRPPRPPERTRIDSPSGLDSRRLYGVLRHARLELAQKLGVRPFVIMDNETMAAVAKAAPTSTAQLEDIPGIGEWRLEHAGPTILETVRGFREAAATPIDISVVGYTDYGWWDPTWDIGWADGNTCPECKSFDHTSAHGRSDEHQVNRCDACMVSWARWLNSCPKCGYSTTRGEGYGPMIGGMNQPVEYRSCPNCDWNSML